MARARMVLAKEEIEDDVWTAAVKRARRLFEEYDDVFVSFSGGKDSTATLHAMLAAAHEKPEERLPLKVIFWDEEAIPLETVDYVRRVHARDDVDLMWFCIPIKCGNACSSKESYWYPWAPEARDKWVRELPPEAITHLDGYDGHDDPAKRLAHYDAAAIILNRNPNKQSIEVLGIRAAESLRRYQAVAKRENDNWIIQNRAEGLQGTTWKAYPIYDWGDDDVWTAPAQFGWDYNRAYDMQEMHGLPKSYQRMGPPFGHEPMRALHMWATCYPEVWDKMVERVPGARTAARYSTTALYSHGDYPKKPEGITWQEFIMQRLENRPKDERYDMAKRIASEIRNHKRNTKDLIPEHTPHPDTGASWDFWAMLATRGDRMGRKDMTYRRVLGKGRDDAYRRYQKDIQNVRDEKRLREII